jgi:hypothetical protein
MKPAIRIGLFVAPVLAVSAALLIAADIHPVQPSDLTVHEWGTFTSVAAEDGSAAEWDALGRKSDLPSFVHDGGYRCTKAGVSGTVRMETPVMYFYSPRNMEAHVKVAFPQGLITEWYPGAGFEIYQQSGADGSVKRLPANRSGIDFSLRTLTGVIEWSNIKIQPGAVPALPLESEPSRYYAARATDAAPITVGDQHEKFLFYRGVGRFPVPLSAQITADGKILVEHSGIAPVAGVFLFENHEGGMGYRTASAAGQSVTLDPPALDGSVSQLRRDLENILEEQGLYPKEAQAMIETWHDSWFEEGSRLIYVLPTAAVNGFLPLEVEPAPMQTARVFVGRIELVTPETKRSVESAVTREDWKFVAQYERFLGPILAQIYTGDFAKMGRIENEVRRLRYSNGVCQ